MAKQALNFVLETYCKSCGQCCAELARQGEWFGNQLEYWQKNGRGEKNSLDPKDKNYMGLIAKRETLEEFDRAKYIGKPLREKDGCEMVYEESEKWYCLVRVDFGTDVLQPACFDTYPKQNELCLRQKKEKK